MSWDCVPSIADHSIFENPDPSQTGRVFLFHGLSTDELFDHFICHGGNSQQLHDQLPFLQIQQDDS